MQNLWGVKDMITVGCDPEIALVDVKFNKFIDTDENYDMYGKVGEVASPSLGALHCEEGGIEFHPGASRSPRRVVKRLYTLFQRLQEKVLPTDYKLATIGHNNGGNAMGGHIHLGGDESLLRPYTGHYKYGIGYTGEEYKSWLRDEGPARHATRVAVSLLKILEDPACARERYSHGYGGIHSERVHDRPKDKRRLLLNIDHRRLSRNTGIGGVTWEIRSPSPDWASHPDLAVAALTLAQKAASHRKELAPVINPVFPYKEIYDREDECDRIDDGDSEGGITIRFTRLSDILRANLDRTLVDTIVEFGGELEAERKANVKKGLGKYVLVKTDAIKNWEARLTNAPIRAKLVAEAG